MRPQANALSKGRVPNRVLDLEELERPFFRGILARMDRLLERERDCYLHPGKRWEYPWALERAALSPGSRVLDAGCGASVSPRLRLEGELDLTVDWPGTRAAMRRFHGYPYTSVGIVLVRE